MHLQRGGAGEALRVVRPHERESHERQYSSSKACLIPLQQYPEFTVNLAARKDRILPIAKTTVHSCDNYFSSCMSDTSSPWGTIVNRRHTVPALTSVNPREEEGFQAPAKWAQHPRRAPDSGEPKGNQGSSRVIHSSHKGWRGKLHHLEHTVACQLSPTTAGYQGGL